ncbi:MAG: thiamine pyrophosphate-dependent enzyme [Alphaproteobacteria bacterium]|nr:thiamine pyrophosphate-dependent enzyme [Alphaproteobacteria bacterium]
MTININKLEPKDYASNQEVRWCPGCGDYAILKAVKKTLSDLELAPEKIVFISGIGCASRFPYYLQTYGFHTIHGRAAAIATGVTLANPALDIWIISGDGDSLSIGSNHLLHLLRRNLNLVYLLFNNETYGLTKGQLSPTARLGTRSPTSLHGSENEPVHSARYALGAGASFVARSVDVAQKHLLGILRRAHDHKGTALVEILQNCPIFNDGIFHELTNKKNSPDHILELHHGNPMIWGVNHDKGLVLDPVNLSVEAVTIGCDGISETDLLCHDEKNENMAWMLAGLNRRQGMPTPVGVFYAVNKPMLPQLKNEDPGKEDLHQTENLNQKIKKLLDGGHAWTVS